MVYASLQAAIHMSRRAAMRQVDFFFFWGGRITYLSGVWCIMHTAVPSVLVGLLLNNTAGLGGR